jgi:hypothetical protein
MNMIETLVTGTRTFTSIELELLLLLEGLIDLGSFDFLFLITGHPLLYNFNVIPTK